jgi:hypothetical protein
MTLKPDPWAERHPSVKHFQPLFHYDQLPVPLRQVSQIFHDAAVDLLDLSPQDGPELTVALRKLWEAKNSAVVHNGFVRDATAAPVQGQPAEEYPREARQLGSLTEEEKQVLRDAGVPAGTTINETLLDMLMKGKGV